MKKDTIYCPVELFQKPPEIFAGLMPLDRKLYTRRLYLRRLRKTDAVELLALYRQNRQFLSQWLQPLPEALRLHNMVELVKEDHYYVKKGLRLDLGIFSGVEEQLLGRVALHSVDYGIQRSAGLSYWITEEMSGQGLMTEALATVISFAFEEACLHRIWINIIDENQPSLAIAAKLGFRREGSLRRTFLLTEPGRIQACFRCLRTSMTSSPMGGSIKNGLAADCLVVKSRRRESNPRPTHYEGVALPLSYSGTTALLILDFYHGAAVFASDFWCFCDSE